jgi:hypothetical protein
MYQGNQKFDRDCISRDSPRPKRIYCTPFYPEPVPLTPQ